MSLRFYLLAICAKMPEAMKILVNANVAKTETAVAKTSRALARHHALLRSLTEVFLGIAASNGSRV